MSLSIPNRQQKLARSNHAREPRRPKHTSKRLQRMVKHVKLSGVDYFEAVAKTTAEEDALHSQEEAGEYKCDHCQEDFLIDHGLVSYPAAGYDADGYEMNDRGLHLYTGLDRSGRNRVGTIVVTQQSQNVLQGEAAAYDDPDYQEDEDDYEEYGEFGCDDQYHDSDAENDDDNDHDLALQQDEQDPQGEENATEDEQANGIVQFEDTDLPDNHAENTMELTNDMIDHAIVTIAHDEVEALDAVQHDDRENMFRVLAWDEAQEVYPGAGGHDDRENMFRVLAWDEAQEVHPGASGHEELSDWSAW
ncbi:uncharacterized protein N0V89_009398 [Didymosphaeria variabile]|uniref:Uncharacterized protein n=1 Tax=Didymosphaeria variabile TaxID=1932322 RepID=A0A9W9C788_9PLEO|nr:uncharacterized protein N0V89_009398 [Didymosphaeria variabile]KAJ4348026.1 hypothetical protein N0V89_009398 [Didymosphaeria variabile]